MPFDGSLLTQDQRDFLRAREILLSWGWQPRCGSLGAGPQCIVSALHNAVDNWGRKDELWDKMAAVAGFDNRDDLTAWNDDQKSAEPVLALFDRVIAGT
jgi:hypothetical protein